MMRTLFIALATIAPDGRTKLTDMDSRLKAIEAKTDAELRKLRSGPSSFVQTGVGSMAHIKQGLRELKAETAAEQAGVQQELAEMKAHYVGDDAQSSFLQDDGAKPANADEDFSSFAQLQKQLQQVGQATKQQRQELAAWNQEWHTTAFADASHQIEGLRAATKTSFLQTASSEVPGAAEERKQVDLAASFAAIKSKMDKLWAQTNKSLDTERDELVDSGQIKVGESLNAFLADPTKDKPVNRMFRSMRTKFSSLQEKADKELSKIGKDLKKSRERKRAMERGLSSFLEVEPSFDDLQAQLAEIKQQTKKELAGISSSLAEKTAQDQMRSEK